MILAADGRTIGSAEPAQTGRQVEIVRSVSFKLNLGNYQSMDFFCSQKASCNPDEADQVSADLYEWCYEQVMDSVREIQKKQAAKAAKERQ